MAEIQIRERPILFSAPMVPAILEGRKTQTRRIVKPQPESPCVLAPDYAWPKGLPTCIWPTPYTLDDGSRPDHFATCRYGAPGDHLWCRETWALVLADEDGIDDWVDRGPIPDALPWPGWQVWYRAGHAWAYDHPDDRGFRWRSPVHMPRWASRITLEITGVRVERLHDISEADKIAEGATPEMPFGTVWRQINTKPGIRWEDNPWVWVISFRRLANG